MCQAIMIFFINMIQHRKVSNFYYYIKTKVDIDSRWCLIIRFHSNCKIWCTAMDKFPRLFSLGPVYIFGTISATQKLPFVKSFLIYSAHMYNLNILIFVLPSYLMLKILNQISSLALPQFYKDFPFSLSGSFFSHKSLKLLLSYYKHYY